MRLLHPQLLHRCPKWHGRRRRCVPSVSRSWSWASSSMSPALLCFPHTISLLSCSPPQAFTRPCIAKKASPVTAVIAVLLAIVVIGGHPTVADGHQYGILQCIRGLEGLWTLYTGAIGTDIAAGGDGLVGRGFRLHFGRLH